MITILAMAAIGRITNSLVSGVNDTSILPSTAELRLLPSQDRGPSRVFSLGQPCPL